MLPRPALSRELGSFISSWVGKGRALPGSRDRQGGRQEEKPAPNWLALTCCHQREALELPSRRNEVGGTEDGLLELQTYKDDQ